MSAGSHLVLTKQKSFAQFPVVFDASEHKQLWSADQSGGIQLHSQMMGAGTKINSQKVNPANQDNLLAG